MNAPAGWYVDLDDPKLETYWNGGAWLRSRTRPRTPGAVDIADVLPAPIKAASKDVDEPVASAMLRHAELQTEALQRIRGYVAFLAWVVAIGIALGIVGGLIAVVAANRS